MDRNEFFREVSIRITGHLDIVSGLTTTFDYLKDIIPCDHLFIEFFNPEEGSAKIYAKAWDGGASREHKVIHIPERVARGLKPGPEDGERIVVINDLDTHPIGGLISAAIGHRGNSALVIPLSIEDDILGALIIEAFGKDQFKAEHEKLVRELIKPFSIALSNCIKHDEVIRLKDILISDKKYYQQEILSLSGSQIIGADYGLKDVMTSVRQVARTNAPVLLLGETGVGKDVIANYIHYTSSRAENPYIKVNSGAIPENLIDSELFGHEKGAFTGALSEKRGRFERANRGSLFLDEVGELPLNAQVRMLRVLQNRELERVGGTKPIPIDIRIIAATHRNLEEMISTGEFREDLWFRLNVFPIIIPPLRERREDIPSLVNYFIHKKSVEHNLKNIPSLDSGSLKSLIDYDWPGNVRELENVIERALITYSNGPLIVTGLEKKRKSLNRSTIATLDEYTKEYIEDVLDICNGVIHGDKGASRILGVKATTLRYKMDKLGINYKKR